MIICFVIRNNVNQNSILPIIVVSHRLQFLNTLKTIKSIAYYTLNKQIHLNRRLLMLLISVVVAVGVGVSIAAWMVVEVVVVVDIRSVGAVVEVVVVYTWKWAP